MKIKNRDKETGFILITTMLFLGLILLLIGAYAVSTRLELATMIHSKDSVSGFYAAEAGLNIRAQSIRQIFVGYNRPTGTSPSATDPCSTGNIGTGDYACESYTFGNHTALTFR